MMPLAAFSGTLLSRRFLASLASSDPFPGEIEFARALRAIVRQSSALGRTAPPREVADSFGAPLLRLLGFEVRALAPAGDGLTIGLLVAHQRAVAVLGAAPGETPLHVCRVPLIAAALAKGVRWCFIANGRQLALVDGARPHAHRFLAFDAAASGVDPGIVRALRATFGADALRAGDTRRPAPLEVMAARSDAELHDMRAALQAGVERAALRLTAALERTRSRMASPPLEHLFEEALTVVYRILFLQFAESRGLVPVWHPTYRRGYTIEALRESVEAGDDPRGTWDALQAIARLAHRGARAGELTVIPFNGRLFSPAHAPAVARGRVPDRDAAAALTALTLLEAKDGTRTPVPFVDLGVEQLGSIYERVLDFTPSRDAQTGAPALCRGEARKRTGSFYTPRTLTEFIVRRTLQPLTERASTDQILAVKVVDPAMGSGAFLVAACRHLARAYESALVESGVSPGDFGPHDRAAFRRLVARHCLYGVDLNPMAVQLARLSLWLCSLAADKPLSFFDHRLRAGNSLLGASPGDVARRAPGRSRRARGGDPTLFGEDAFDSIGRALEVREALAALADDSVADVRRKEAMLVKLESPEGPLARWRTICDAWCAAWFQPDEGAASARTFGALVAAARGDASFSHPAIRGRLAGTTAAAQALRFFHWQLEFPEVFFPRNGAPGGFDAVLGNPPWDMVRGSEAARQMVRFTRDSGAYRLQSYGHSNAYQLFAERSLQLVRPGGRIGLVLPWGIATDEGSAPLRRALLDRCALDDLVLLDNRDGIFPIHRSIRFAAVCGTAGGRTEAIRYRPAIHDVSDLDREVPIEFSRELIERVSGPSLAVPQLRRSSEVRILDQLTRAAPAAASGSLGWGLQFGRELNASDDRDLFAKSSEGFPVIAGRHLQPFRVNTGESSLRISPARARERLGARVMRHRLAYRDVAGAANRMTLIAAIVPPSVVTTHTVFCLKTRLPLDEQLFLCAVLNSFVANYLVRTRVGTHVTTALVHTLPLPRPARGSAAFTAIVRHAQACVGGAEVPRPGLEAAVAALYGLDAGMFETILSTFPLVPAADREAALAALVRNAAI